MPLRIVCIWCFAWALCSEYVVSAEYSYNTIALTGMTMPGGEVIDNVGSAAINDAGQVLFGNAPQGEVGRSIFLYDAGTFVPIVRRGQFHHVDGERILLEGASMVELSESGTVTMRGDNPEFSISLQYCNGMLSELLRSGDPAPDGNGTFRAANFIEFGPGWSGTTAAFLVDTARPGFDDEAVVVSHNNVLSQILRNGQAGPTGTGYLWDITWPNFALSAGRPTVAFTASVVDSLPQLLDQDASATALSSALDGRASYPQEIASGVFFYDGDSVQSIALDGQPLPNGWPGVLQLNNSPNTALNESGQIAFTVPLTDGGPVHDAMYMYDDGELTEILWGYDTVPDGNGRWGDMGHAYMNRNGQIVFITMLKETAGGADDTWAIGYYDGVETHLVARAGQPAPDGNGIFSSVNAPLLNGAGDIFFRAAVRLTPTSEPVNTIFHRDPSGEFHPIVRTGELFDVDPTENEDLRVIVGAWHSMALDHSFGPADRLNERGTFLFSMTFEDGTQGIFTATVPEPHSLIMVVTLAAAVALWRVRLYWKARRAT